jgi:serine/threonine protein kinase
VQQRRKFQILQPLGKGGFGTVYRAEMTDAGGFAKQVALKIMSYEGDEAEGIARRMRDEARMLGLIRHRAIVGVNSLIPLQDGWGVVMEYIDGVDLSSCIKAGPIPIGAVLEVIEEVAGALEAAYTARVPGRKEALKLVHRDIKPSNIRVTRQGEVKLLDFGVARAEFDAKESQDSSEFVMGSTRYMSPERRRGWETHQGDVYALGLVLANALTRKRFPEPPESEGDHARFLGTVLETVNRALSSHQEEAVRAAAGQVKFLLLEMLAFEPMDRPDAHTVERRIRKVRKALPAPWLREWSDRAVRRVQASAQVPDDIRGDTGKVLLERAGAFDPEEATAPVTPYGADREDSSSIRRPPHAANAQTPPPAPAPPAAGVARATVAGLMAGSFLLGAIVGVLGLMALGG